MYCLILCLLIIIIPIKYLLSINVLGTIDFFNSIRPFKKYSSSNCKANSPGKFYFMGGWKLNKYLFIIYCI